MSRWRVIMAGEPRHTSPLVAPLSQRVQVVALPGPEPDAAVIQTAADVVVLAAGGTAPETAAAVRRWQQACPQWPVIVALTRPDFEEARLAQAAGAAFTIVLPEEAPDLPVLLTALGRQQPTPAAGPVGHAIGVYCPQHGCGVTTLVALLGGALCRLAGAPVLVADMDAAWGGLELMLGLEPDRGWQSLRELLDAGELAGQHMSAVATAHSSGLHLLASLSGGDGDEPLSDSAWARLIAAGRAAYRVSVWDMPPDLVPWRFPGLWASLDQVLVVAAPLLPALHRIQRLAQGLAGLAAGGLPPVGLVYCRDGLDPALRFRNVTAAIPLPLVGRVREDAAAAHLPATGRWPFAGAGRRVGRAAADALGLAGTLWRAQP